MAPGTALAQKRHGGDGITIVTGGDAGTAEGDFATCLVWSSRPGNELPILIIVTNNQWGISTSARRQHGAKRIADRGKAFGMRTKTIDGNDPDRRRTSSSRRRWSYVRTERKPFLLEAIVSRLYGHSSASGANFVNDEVDCLAQFEEKLEAARACSRARQMDAGARALDRGDRRMARQVRDEPQPDGRDHLGAHLRGEEVADGQHGAGHPAWRCTTARSTSASPTSSARTSARRSAASSPPRRA